jgi:hypothetical protein
MDGGSVTGISARLRSAQQLLGKCLHNPAGLALGDESADVPPDSGEVPSRFEFELSDRRLQFGPAGGEAGVSGRAGSWAAELTSDVGELSNPVARCGLLPLAGLGTITRRTEQVPTRPQGRRHRRHHHRGRLRDRPEPAAGPPHGEIRGTV